MYKCSTTSHTAKRGTDFNKRYYVLLPIFCPYRTALDKLDKFFMKSCRDDMYVKKYHKYIKRGRVVGTEDDYSEQKLSKVYRVYCSIVLITKCYF